MRIEPARSSRSETPPLGPHDPPEPPAGRAWPQASSDRMCAVGPAGPHRQNYEAESSGVVTMGKGRDCIRHRASRTVAQSLPHSHQLYCETSNAPTMKKWRAHSLSPSSWSSIRAVWRGISPRPHELTDTTELYGSARRRPPVLTAYRSVTRRKRKRAPRQRGLRPRPTRSRREPCLQMARASFQIGSGWIPIAPDWPCALYCKAHRRHHEKDTCNEGPSARSADRPAPMCAPLWLPMGRTPHFRRDSHVAPQVGMTVIVDNGLI